MKIGFSFGRCVRDIVKGIVNIEDVLCIIARTYMPAEKDVIWVIEQYQHQPGYLDGLDVEQCKDVGVQLWRSGRVLEPRANGVHAMQVPREYVWMDLYPTVAETVNDSVRSSWDAYRMLIGLVEQLPEPNADAVYVHSKKDVARDLANQEHRTPEEIEKERQALNALINSI